MRNILAPPLPGVDGSAEYRAAISSDGQIYVRPGSDGVESRLEPYEWAAALSEDALETMVVRHLQFELRTCRDCEHQEDVVHFSWDQRRCCCCWSRRVDVLTTEVRPPRPPTFGNTGRTWPTWRTNGVAGLDDHVWGVDREADAGMLYRLVPAYRGSPLPRRELLVLLLFAETLATSDSYPPAAIAAAHRVGQFNLTLNIGNVAQEYFRETHAPLGACLMLERFEEAIAFDTDPIHLALAKHSFGMAVILLLDAFDQNRAERVVGRPDVRAQGIKYLRESLEHLEAARDRHLQHQEMWERVQRQEIWVKYALADLLSGGRRTDVVVRGEITAAERYEATEIFRALPVEAAGDYADQILAAGALAQLESPLPAVDDPDERVRDHLEAAMTLKGLIDAPHTTKLTHRWRWSLSIGQFLLRVNRETLALDFLESSITYALKDVDVPFDVLLESADGERFFRAFSVLAGLYTRFGWWEEALSLLETPRGLGVEPAQGHETEQESRMAAALRMRNAMHEGAAVDSPTEIVEDEELHGFRADPFDDDYELPGLVDRLLALTRYLADEPTVLVSLNIDGSTYPGTAELSAIIIGPQLPLSGKVATWRREVTVISGLASEHFRRPSSFREQRLRSLTTQLAEHVMLPIGGVLSASGCRRALLVAPSPLSNLPLEAVADGSCPGAPSCVAFTPSFMIGRLDSPSGVDPRDRRLLILGYEGADLLHADAEAARLQAVFAEAQYIRGRDLTKRRVVEELNRDYDCIHLICHGTYDEHDPLSSALHFRDDWETDCYQISAGELRRFVRLKSQPVVTLSACSTALVSESRSNTWHGLPGSLLAAGARCAIGTRWPVSDRVAADMMGRFYELLAEIPSPLECFHAMQEEMREKRPLEEWASFGYLGLP